jgi:hypothetical protein
VSRYIYISEEYYGSETVHSIKNARNQIVDDGCVTLTPRSSGAVVCWSVVVTNPGFVCLAVVSVVPFLARWSHGRACVRSHLVIHVRCVDGQDYEISFLFFTATLVILSLIFFSVFSIIVDVECWAGRWSGLAEEWQWKEEKRKWNRSPIVPIIGVAHLLLPHLSPCLAIFFFFEIDILFFLEKRLNAFFFYTINLCSTVWKHGWDASALARSSAWSYP